jgi:hypothetical protein
MRPAEIRVFDGLRITTDHLNHLQGAFASGFDDVREILGLGQAHTGLDVALQDDGSVTIQPGTAFDLQKNRLASDNPLNLKVTFRAQDKVKYICLKYEQVEDGIVEGHPTMVWDSCSALVRDQYPAPAENLVTLARVVKRADGKLYVHAACGREPIIEEAEITPVTTQDNGGPPSAAPPPAPDSGSTVAADAGAAPATPAPAGANVSSQAAPQSPETQPPLASPAPTGAAVRCSQGAIALVSDPGAASYLRTVLAPAIRSKAESSTIDLSFTLAQSDLAPGIAASGLSSQGVLSGDLLFPAAPDSTQTPHYRFQSVFHGEAAPAAGTLDQFGTSGINMASVPAQSGALWSTGDFTSAGMGRFTFGAWSEAPAAARPPFPDDVFAGLQLLVQMTPGDKGYQVVLKLQWSGQIAESSIQFLETQDIEFTWGISFGWKAIGS